MSAKDENLREVIERFMDAKNAQVYLDDIEAGERILRKYPAPEPDDMVLANIKANMALHKLPQKPVTLKKRIFEALAVAASIAIIAAVSFRSIPSTPNVSPNTRVNTTGLLPEGWWTHEDTAYVSVMDNYDQISQLAQMEEDNYNSNSFVLDEFESQIQQVRDHLVGMESDIETAGENYGNPSSMLEEIQNQLNELSGSFWQDDYSNAADYE